MKWNLILALICGLMAVDRGNCDVIERSEYNKMPRMFQYDDYDDCLFSDPAKAGTYCLVRVVIKPDNESALWKMIESFSANGKLHLNHAALDRGICVETAMAAQTSLNSSEWNTPKFDINFVYKIGNDAFRNVDADKTKYSNFLNAVINKDLMQTHNLSAYTEIEYCDKSDANDFPIDYLDITFIVILAVLSITTIVSSWYDYSCKSTSGLDHYKQDLPRQKSTFLSSFSLIRNWYRLTSHSRDPLSRDLRTIQTIRFTTFILTLIGHASILVQPRSAWVMEQKYRELPTMIVINGFQIVTTFFGISGIVFTVSYAAKMKETGRKPGLLEIVLITVNRYIRSRLTPIYALVLLLEATWLIRLQDGPFWRRGAETSLTYCRRNWWINMLYLNNYFTMDQPCMQHSWYLAADFQMSFVGLVVVSLALRLKKFKVHLLGVMTSLAFIIPAFVIYLGGFEGVTIFSPEERRYVFWYDEAYHKTYLPTHMNLNMYLCGIVIGFLYIHFKGNDINLKNKLAFRIAFYSIFIVGPVMFLAGQIFYTNDFAKPSMWMATYFTMTHVIWALIVGFGFFGFVFRVSKPLTRLTNLRLFEVLGRLTYGAYVGHFFMLKMMFYNVRELSNLGIFDMATKINGVLILSYILSLALTMMIELPVSAMQKQLLRTFVKPVKRDDFKELSQHTTLNSRNGHMNDSFTNALNGKISFHRH